VAPPVKVRLTEHAAWRVPQRPHDAIGRPTLAIVTTLGVLIVQTGLPAFGAEMGLGHAGRLTVLGVILPSIAPRPRGCADPPAVARHLLKDPGLIAFVAIMGLRAGNPLLARGMGVRLTDAGYLAMLPAQ
jgi:uncharacterized transporter YbjL